MKFGALNSLLQLRTAAVNDRLNGLTEKLGTTNKTAPANDWLKQFLDNLAYGSTKNDAKPDTGGKPDTGAKPDTGGQPDTGGEPDTGGQPTTGAPPSGDNDTPATLSAFEAEVLRLVNEYREANGKAALDSDPRLNTVADEWSENMATSDFIGHGSPNTVKNEGYDYSAWGENVAGGQQTPEQVVNAWIASPGHRANMLSDKYEDIGIGHYYLANDTGKVNYGHYWTTVFASESESMMS